MRSEVGTSRVEAFSDGVFAIALTLLILEIRVPHATPDHTLWAGLVALWPSYVAFVLSFFVVLVMWVNHHELMRLARTVSYPFLFANGLLLLSVTFVPFPTAILAQYLATADAKVAVAFYCGSFLVNSLAWNLLFATIVRGRLLRPDIDAATIVRIRRAYVFGPVVYAVATIAALFQPVLGLVVNASLWLLWIGFGYHSTRQDVR